MLWFLRCSTGLTLQICHIELLLPLSSCYLRPFDISRLSLTVGCREDTTYIMAVHKIRLQAVNEYLHACTPCQADLK